METEQVLLVFGGLLLALGIMFLFLKRSAEKKLDTVRSTKTVTAKELNNMVAAGSPGQMVQVNGTIESDTPLTGQLSQEKCVYCRTSVHRDYEETYRQQDSEGRDMPATRRGSERINHAENHTHFYVIDETGKVRVNPQNAEIDLTKTVDKFEPANALQFTGNSLHWGNFSFNINKQDRNTRGRTTIGYRFTEEIMPLNQQVTVLGEAASGPQEVTISKPGKGTFIISTKSREGLTSSMEGNIRYMKIGAALSLVIGAALLMAGLLS